MDESDRKTQKSLVYHLLLWGLGIFYAVITIAQWSIGYIDFGDGNYMYIARRITEGAVIYRDILAPQPPCHLFLGALLVKISDIFNVVFPFSFFEKSNYVSENPLFVFRGFSLLLHLATFLLVVRLAQRAWGRRAIGLVAGAIYLWLPIGYWWSLGYQSEPLEIVFLLLMMLGALRGDGKGDLAAGVCGALAALTNATAAPFLLVLIIYMSVRAPLRALRMAIPCLLLAGAVTTGLEAWTGGAFLRTVVFKQIGTYPGDSLKTFLNYAVFNKLIPQGRGVLWLEGAFVFIALIGLWRYLRESPLDPLARGGLGWFCITTLGSIVYVTKGGTMDYIFSLAEPAVAILAAGELMAWGARWRVPAAAEPGSGRAPFSIPFAISKLVAAALLAVYALGPAVYFYYQLGTQNMYELNTLETGRVQRLIRTYSNANEPILAPPYYAFISNRTLWGDYSELYIWSISYGNDRHADRIDGEGFRKVKSIQQALQDRRLPLVILEMDQTGKIPEVMTALQDDYIPIKHDKTFLLWTRNTRLGFFIPVRNPQDAKEAEERKNQWRQFKTELASVYGPQAIRGSFGYWFFGEPAGSAPPSAPASSQTHDENPVSAASSDKADP